MVTATENSLAGMHIHSSLHAGLSINNKADRNTQPVSPSTPLVHTPLLTPHNGFQHTGFSPPPESLVSTREGSPENAEHALKEAFNAYKLANYQHVVHILHQLQPVMSHRADFFLLLGACQYQLGQYTACVASNDAAILLCPTLAEAHANLANALQQLGQIDLAVMYYTSAIRLKPDFGDAYANRASAYLRRGMIVQAAESYRAALTLDRNLPGLQCGLGDLWRCQGPSARPAAMQCYATALSTDPTNMYALRGIADCHREGGNPLLAIPLYKQVLSLAPTLVDARIGLAMSLRESGQYNEAEQEFQCVLMLKPNCPLALGNLASVYYEGGKLEAAIGMYQLALSKQPNFPEALNNCGNCYRELGKLNEAVACYRGCIQLQLLSTSTTTTTTQQQQLHGGSTTTSLSSLSSGLLPAGNSDITTLHPLQQQQTSRHLAQCLAVSYNNLAGVLKLQSRIPECITAYQQVTLLQPSPEAYANIGSAYKDAGLHQEAIRAYTQALVLRPDFYEAFSNQFHSKQCICDWSGREEDLERLERDVRKELAIGTKLPSVQPFHALGYPFSPDLALYIATRYAQQCLLSSRRFKLSSPLPHPPALPITKQQPGGGRLRVGYVSSDFGNHPLSHLMGSVFGLHDRNTFEIFCYALSADDGSEWRQRISTEAEHFIDVSSWTSVDIARRISQDQIHLAINLNGYTKGARNDIFALLPAPVQCQYMGFPATMGASYIPWILLDSVVCPPESRGAYSECVAYMPRGYSYFVNDYRHAHPHTVLLEEQADSDGGSDGGSGSGGEEQYQQQQKRSSSSSSSSRVITRADVGLPEDKVIYYCANQLYKYDPQVFTTWCNILKQVPHAVLWLLRFPPAGEHHVKHQASLRGIDPCRIIFTDVAPKTDHIQRSGLADVFLDTPHCNAHTTGCDVLWSGTPMITFPLLRMASRVGASLCGAAGLADEMVVNSMQEYEERAVELGLNTEKRLALRRKLADARKSCKLFDTVKWVGAYEKVLMKMWEIHCEGGGPRDFEIVEE